MTIAFILILILIGSLWAGLYLMKRYGIHKTDVQLTEAEIDLILHLLMCAKQINTYRQSISTLIRAMRKESLRVKLEQAKQNMNENPNQH